MHDMIPPFVHVFSAVTKVDLENVMYFQVNLDLYQKCLALPENIKESARNPDVIAAAEADVQLWMKIMERVRDFPTTVLSEPGFNFFFLANLQRTLH